MKYTNLANSPEFVEKTVKLIEMAFDYSEENSFEVDFYPLLKPENHKHCHIYIDNDEVIAHIGCLNKDIHIKENAFPITMYGGIAVHPDHQGKGLFKSLYNEIKTQYTQSTFHLLWSEKVELYEKLNFHPCVQLIEYEALSEDDYEESLINFETSYLNELNTEEKETLKAIYNNKKEILPTRTNKDWIVLEQITSAQLYIQRDTSDKIINYFFKNKGQDLTDIIHEYGKINSKELQAMRAHGNVWTTFIEDIPESQVLFATLIKVGDQKVFSKFIESYTGFQIKNITDENIEFKFDQEKFILEHANFLQGVFGPGRFQELDIPWLFIPGLDSI